MLYKARSVLRKESTQSLPNVTSFLKLLKEFRFLKGARIISLNFSPYYRSFLNTLVKATACTFYATCQHKM